MSNKTIVVIAVILYIGVSILLLGPYSGGQAIGGIVSIWLLYTLIGFLAKKIKNDSPVLRMVSGVITYMLASTLYAFGSADGGDPNFLIGFSLYILPTLFVVPLDLYLHERQEEQ